MAAAKAKGKLVSLVVNNEYIKICEVTKSVKTITVHKTVTIPTPDGCYKEGYLDNIVDLAKAIKVVMDEHRFSANSIAFSISSSRLATKEVLIPNVKANKITQLIDANATEYFPVNMNEYIVQHTVLEKVEDQGQEKLKVMVAAVPSEITESYYELAKALGLKVLYIDYVGNSTFQIMKQQIGPEVSLVIQVENDGTVINIFNNNVLQLQRIVPYGKSMLVNAVMEKYNLKYDAATEKLQNETLLHSRFDGDEVTESLRYMTNNVNRVIDYFVSRNRLSIEKAYLIGHSTTIKGFATLLSNEMNMPIIKVEQLKGVVADKKSYIEEAMLTSYVTNLGAAIDPVNFVPKKFQEEVSKKENTKTIVIGFFGAIAVSALLILVPLAQMTALQVEIASLNKDISKLSEINEVVDDYYTAKDKFADITAFAVLTSDYDDSLEDFIDYLEKNIPSDVTISNLNVASGSITITGTAGSKSSVAKLIQQLQKSTDIVNVDVPTITESKDNAGNIEDQFSLSCTYTGISSVTDAAVNAVSGNSSKSATESTEKTTEAATSSSETQSTTSSSGTQSTTSAASTGTQATTSSSGTQSTTSASTQSTTQASTKK